MEFNSPIELYNWMHKNISYKHTGKFLSVEEVMKNKYGDCHDQANFACHYLTKMGLKCGRLFMVEYNTWNSPGGATHTLVYFIQNNKYYWFENAWGNQSGIHKPFNTLQELKDDIASKWNYSGKNTKLYMSEYKSVKPGSNLNDYVIINTPENDPKKYYSKDKDEIKMNSKALENFLIPEVAEEGLISNFKARRAKRKIEKIANKMDNDEKIRKFKEECKKYLPVIKKIMEDTINQLKKKYPKAPVNPYFYNEDEFIEVTFYDNEFVTNEYSEDYIEDAEKLFDEAYSIIKNKIENYKGGFGILTLKIEIPENNCINIKFY